MFLQKSGKRCPVRDNTRGKKNRRPALGRLILKELGFQAPHFHCTKPRCGYRFVGRSHINKHQMHHQRVASLERNDFKRFKMNQDCYYETCQFRLKNTHFHCLRCSFV